MVGLLVIGLIVELIGLKKELGQTRADLTRFQAFLWEPMIDSDGDDSKRNDIRALMRKREFRGYLGYMSQSYFYTLQLDEYPDDQFRILDEIEVRIRTHYLGKRVKLTVVPDWRYQYVGAKYWIVTDIEIASEP